MRTPNLIHTHPLIDARAPRALAVQTRMKAIAWTIAVVALTLAVAIASSAGASTKSKCQRLKGKDLAPAHKVKLTRRANDEGGTDLRGCVLPRGHVYRIASSTHLGTLDDGYTVKQVARWIVLVRTTRDSQYGSSSMVIVSNLKTGHSYTVANQCLSGGTGPCSPSEESAAAFINKRGQAVAANQPNTPDPLNANTTVIAGFSSSGTRCDLDTGLTAQIPATSLTLQGSLASWTHAGAARSATLPGCPAP